MTSSQEADQVIEQSHAAWRSFVNGDPEPAKALFSQRDDVSLGNPFGPFVRGWAEAAQTMERAAALYRDGEVLGFELVSKFGSGDLACIAEVERYRVKVAGADDPSLVTLRVTSVFRREDNGWKIVHRHADPITSARSAESVIQG